MDDAARLVSPADLARLSRLRARREAEAARRLRALAAAEAEAAATLATAQDRLRDRRAARLSGERAIYDGLADGGPLGAGALMERLGALSRLGERVAAAEAAEAGDREALAASASAREQGRAGYAQVARSARRWERARDRILRARSTRAEGAAEIAAEDEQQMRRGRRP